MRRACCLPTPSGPFTAPVPERASLSSMEPPPRLYFSTVKSLRAETGLLKFSIWSPAYERDRGDKQPLSHTICIALLDSKEAQCYTTSICPQQELSPLLAPPQKVTSLYGCSSCHWAAPLSEYGQTLPSKELSLVQGHCLFFWRNEVDRVTDTTNHQSGLNSSWGHWGICLVTCG